MAWSGSCSYALFIANSRYKRYKEYVFPAGIPALVVAAASFDDLVAITFYTIFASVSIRGGNHGDVAWQIAEGPVQLVFGVVGGLLAGLLASWTKVWDTRWKRAGLVFCLCASLLSAPHQALT